MEGADNCESSQNNNMEDGGNPAADTNDVMPEQTLSSDHEQPLSFGEMIFLYLITLQRHFIFSTTSASI